MKRFERFQKRSAAKPSAEVKLPSSSFSCVATIKGNISRSLEQVISSSAERSTAQEPTLGVTGDASAGAETVMDTIGSDESTSAVSGSVLLMAATPASDGTESASTSTDETDGMPSSIALPLSSSSSQFSVSHIENDDKAVRFYTGLPSWAVFVYLYNFLSPYLVHTTGPRLFQNKQNELLIVLMKLRLNLMLEDLSRRFEIGTGSVSRVMQRWLNVMYVRLKFLIVWPTRDIIRKSVPNSIKQHYPACVCTIDCSEIFIDTPTNFKARAQTYSNYKRHNTIKFLIGITPNGSISFLSRCWGGRVSDKNLISNTTFYKLLLPGDVVLANRGFTIEEDMMIYGAKLEIPSFTKGKKQLSQREVEQSAQLSRVRVHVERVIGALKNKYTILKGPIPTPMVKHADDTEVANIDKILTVCAALTNLCPSVVS